MPAPKIAAVEFLDALPAAGAPGQARVRVALDAGRDSVFLAATYDRPAAWTREGGGFWFGEPTLYARELNAATVRAAAEAMAAELGGFWLRYYRASPGRPSAVGLGSARLDRVEPGRAVLEAVLKDGREFSMFAADPDWWREELERRGFHFYFGPQAIFLKPLDGRRARAAAKAMAVRDEQLFCRHDTPRRTLGEILDAFSAARARG